MKKPHFLHRLLLVTLLLTVMSFGSLEAAAASLAAPKLVSVKAVSVTSVKLTWESVKDAAGYAVVRSGSRTTGFKTLKKLDSATSLTWTDTTVSKGKVYYYKVRAYKKSGTKTIWGSYSATASVKTGSVTKKKTQDSFAKAVAEMNRKNDAGNDRAIVSDDPYASGRLIVRGRRSGISFDQYSPTQVIEGPDNMYILQFGNASAAKKACGLIKKLDTVEYAEPDEYVVALGFPAGDPVSEVPTSSIADVDSMTESFAATSSHLSWGASAVRSDKYAASLKGKGTIKVAVIDSGVGYHSFINSRILSGGYDYIDNDSNPRNDGHGHGTHVSGIIVDNTPGLNVKILPIRVLDSRGSGSNSTVAMGVQYAISHGAKVINMSLGGGHSSYLDSVIESAVKKGIVCVVSSGNNNSNTATFCPAHMSSVITVGATDSSDRVASFSNYGSALDVTAPGVGIYSCIPGGMYESWNGTSMAAPFVTAAAAMYRLNYPSRTPAQIKSLIRSNVRDLGASGWDQFYGTGRIQLPASAGGGTGKTVSPTSVKLNKTSASISAGNSLQLTATVYPVTATNKSVTWSTSNSSVATVSSGTVKGKKAGTATITVKTANGKKASCKVTVKASKTPAPSGTISLTDLNLGASAAQMKKAAKAVKKGTATICARRGYAKFTAPAAGAYTFTYSNLRTKGVSGYDYNRGLMIFLDSNSYFKYISTVGGSTPTLRVASSYAATGGTSAEAWLTSRSAKVNLKKGETIYIYHDLGYGNTLSYVKLAVR